MADDHDESFRAQPSRWPLPAKTVPVLTGAAVGSTVGGIADALWIDPACNLPAWIGASVVGAVAAAAAPWPSS